MKKILLNIINFILHIFWLFSIKEQVFCESYGGTQYSCNPKYISESIDSHINQIWYLKNKKLCTNRNCKIITKKGIKYFYYILTSRVAVTNVGFSEYIPFRNKQTIINTWHGGGAYKIAYFGNQSPKSLKRYFNKNSVFVSTCSLANNKIIRGDFGFSKKILECGYPRNDILFSSSNCRSKICDFVNDDSVLETLWVLYAPTYRDTGMDKTFYEKLNIYMIKDTLEKKFNKKVTFFVRAHHFSNEINKYNDSSIKSLSDYPDMQEILSSIDILITDYSSSLWDFSLRKKPCFIFAPDLEEYISKRSFYLSIYDWGFPVSQTNDDFVNQIKLFDEKEYISSIENIHKQWGSFETGNATNVVKELIYKKLGFEDINV